jgi:hypothetical protein
MVAGGMVEARIVHLSTGSAIVSTSKRYSRCVHILCHLRSDWHWNVSNTCCLVECGMLTLTVSCSALLTGISGRYGSPNIEGTNWKTNPISSAMGRPLPSLCVADCDQMALIYNHSGNRPREIISKPRSYRTHVHVEHMLAIYWLISWSITRPRDIEHSQVAYVWRVYGSR